MIGMLSRGCMFCGCGDCAGWITLSDEPVYKCSRCGRLTGYDDKRRSIDIVREKQMTKSVLAVITVSDDTYSEELCTSITRVMQQETDYNIFQIRPLNFGLAFDTITNLCNDAIDREKLKALEAEIAALRLRTKNSDDLEAKLAAAENTIRQLRAELYDTEEIQTRRATNTIKDELEASTKKMFDELIRQTEAAMEQLNELKAEICPEKVDPLALCKEIAKKHYTYLQSLGAYEVYRTTCMYADGKQEQHALINDHTLLQRLIKIACKPEFHSFIS